MELWTPDSIELNEATRALMRDVQETADRVDAHRPLPEAVVKRIEEELLGERVYSSNALEGSTLDLRETVMILKQGVLGARRKREATEARNLGEAARRITTWIDSDKECHGRAKLLEIHGMVLREIEDNWAGRFRAHRVMIRGAVHQPPHEAEVPELVDRVMAIVTSGSAEPVVRAAWAHWAIARIHPFHDGNGRMARLWQDLILSQGGLTCAVIRPEDRGTYLEALGCADDGDFNPIVQLVVRRVSSTFDRYIVEIGSDQELDGWVQQLVGEADVGIGEKRKLEFIRWSRKMEQLRAEFELCASRITDTSEEVKVQVRRYDIIDQTRWENIRSGLGATQTWFFRIDFHRRAKHLRYYFFFGKHYWTDLDGPEERRESRTSLLLSEDLGSGDPDLLRAPEDSPVALREVVVVDNKLVCKRVAHDKSELEYERGVPPLRVAQEFMQDVILHRLT